MPGSITSDTGDPLVSLARNPSLSLPLQLPRSHVPTPSVDSNGDSDIHAHILEDMESSAATSSRNRKREKRRREEQCQEEEDTWMQDIRATMQANQALLQKLVEQRPYSDREALVRFVADTLLWGSLQPYFISWYLVPETRRIRVMATFRPGSRGALQLVVCLIRAGVSLCTISLYIAGGIFINLVRALGSSLHSLSMRRL